MLCYSVVNEQFWNIGLTNIGHILLSKPNWLNPYAVTTAKRILLFKVTELEHERQNESNVLSVIKTAPILFTESTKRSFLKYLV